MEISTKKISHTRLSFEPQFKIEFFGTFTSGTRCLEFSLDIFQTYCDDFFRS